MADTRTVELRPATEADRPFLLAVYAASRAEELDQVAWPEGQREAFVAMQFAAQDADYRRRNPDASYDVVEVDGRPVGRLYVDRRPHETHVIDIALLPEHRGSGLGTLLLGRILDEAAAAGRPVTIAVEIHNRAARLYERLGFVAVAEQGIHRQLEWVPR